MPPYLPFLYTYSVGGIVFALGLFFAWRQGYINCSGRGLRNLAVCLFVAVFFLAIQGYLQFAPMSTAPQQEYQGGTEHVLEENAGVRGAAIDYVIMAAYFLAILAVGTWS